MTDDKPSLDDAVKHYGVKGMHWGVRNAYLDSYGYDHARSKRVIKGTASRTDRLENSQSLHLSDYTKGYLNTGKLSVKAATEAKLKDEQAHIRRVKEGEATVNDLLKMYSKVNLLTVVLGGMDKYRKPDAPKK